MGCRGRGRRALSQRRLWEAGQVEVVPGLECPSKGISEETKSCGRPIRFESNCEPFWRGDALRCAFAFLIGKQFNALVPRLILSSIDCIRGRFWKMILPTYFSVGHILVERCFDGKGRGTTHYARGGTRNLRPLPIYREGHVNYHPSLLKFHCSLIKEQFRGIALRFFKIVC